MAGCSNAGYRVISRANALLLPHSYRHAAHVMLHSPCREDKKLFGYYPARHAVMVSAACRIQKYFIIPENHDAWGSWLALCAWLVVGHRQRLGGSHMPEVCLPMHPQCTFAGERDTVKFSTANSKS
jgi:hypothetical protein